MPLRSFQKEKIQEYKHILNGTLEYEGPNRNPESFQGYLKIKKDPKVEQLGIDQFIPRGSVLRNTEWLIKTQKLFKLFIRVFGLVVFTGADTKIYLNSKYKKTKRSFLLEMAHLFFVVIWIGMIACVVVNPPPSPFSQILILI